MRHRLARGRSRRAHGFVRMSSRAGGLRRGEHRLGAHGHSGRHGREDRCGGNAASSSMARTPCSSARARAWRTRAKSARRRTWLSRSPRRKSERTVLARRSRVQIPRPRAVPPAASRQVSALERADGHRRVQRTARSRGWDKLTDEAIDEGFSTPSGPDARAPTPRGPDFIVDGRAQSPGTSTR